MPTTEGNFSHRMSEANESPSKRLRTEDADKSFQCQICSRTYERADHLSRHLDSHRNERSFKCHNCPAAFNRKDLLVRHKVAHAKQTVGAPPGHKRRTERASKACASCIASKVKCDNSRPCQRCMSRNIACEPCIELSQRRTFAAPDAEKNMPEGSNLMPSISDGGAHSRTHSLTDVDEVLTGPTDYELMNETAAQMNNLHGGSAVGDDLRIFFEQIMVPELQPIHGEYLQPPLELTAWMPEIDHFGELDLFGSSFLPNMDQIFEPQFGLQHTHDTPGSLIAGDVMQPINNRGNENTPRRRDGDIRNFPWLYPTLNQHALTEHENSTIDGQTIDLASSPHQPYNSDVVVPSHLSPASRDSIFKLVTGTAQAHISIPSFPDADCLDKLIKVGIAKQTENDAWLHPYTFDSNSAIPELLTALVAAGCICFGIPAVNRTGLTLQEISRMALNKLAEKDESVTQSLQYLQASMIWIDIGAFCGYRRKMMVAESSLQVIVTALRRSGRFEEVRSQDIVPTMDDPQVVLESKWRSWVEKESYKRLVYHLWEHDIGMALLKHRQPLISYAELVLSLPASRSLWMAPTADAWRSTYSSQSFDHRRLSLRDLLMNSENVSSPPMDLDKNIMRSAYLHGMAAQIWEYYQQAVLLGESSDRSLHLWLQLRQENIYQQLQRVEFTLGESPASACLLHQFLQMYLHANIDTVMRFAGRCDEGEAHRAYTQLQLWSATKDARVAICHAGQVLRNARRIPPYQFRGPDSFMVYHAIMLLWTYSMILRDRAEKTTSPDPPPTTAYGESISDTVVLDDCSLDQEVKRVAYISANRGTPSLQIIATHHSVEGRGRLPSQTLLCNLKYPSQVMEVGVSLLLAAHPGVHLSKGPPLIRALLSLMEELRKL